MAITLNDVTELRNKIVEGRKKLEEQEGALRVLEAMISDSLVNTNDQGEIDLGSLPVDIEPKKTPLSSIVGGIVKRFGDQEFTVRHIESVLIKQDQLPKSKNPRARIAMVMKKLLDSETVTCTHEGKGNDPYRYKNKSSSGSKPLKIIENKG